MTVLTATPGATLVNDNGNDTDVFSPGSAPISGGGDTVVANTSGGTANIYLTGVNPDAVTMWDNSAGVLFIQFSPTDEITVDGGTGGASGITLHGLSAITFDSAYEMTWGLTGGLSLTAASNNQEIYGTVGGGDTLTALGMNDTLDVFGGTETLVAGPGSTLINGTGHDTDKFSLGSATVASGGGDTITANTGPGLATINFTGIAPGAVTMWDTSSGQLKFQFSSTDIVTVNGGTFSPTSGVTVHGLSGVTFDPSYAFGYSLTGGLNLTATSNGQEIYGTAVGGDTLKALGTNDTLEAFGGTETLVAGAGSTLINGAGHDTDVFGLGDAPVSGGGDTVMANTGAGIGTLNFTGVAPSAVTMWDTSSGQLKFQYSATDIVTVTGGAFSPTSGLTVHGLGGVTFDPSYAFGYSLTGGLNLTATSNGQEIYGTAVGGDTLKALGTNDTLEAFGGTETLVAGAGSTLINGAGHDTDVFGLGDAPVSGGGDTVMANTGAGIGTLNFTGVAPSAVTMWDTSSGQLKFQYSATDIVTVTGGAFSPTSGLTVHGLGGVTFDPSYAFGFSLTGGLNLTATSNGQEIYGTAVGGDTLTALGTNDTLEVFGGTETLIAGPGSTLINGSGVDTDKFSAGSATVSGGTGDTILASTGPGIGNIFFTGILPGAVTMWDTSSGQLKLQFSPTDIVTVMGGTFSSATGFTEHGLGSVTFDTPNNFGFSLTGGLNLTASANGQEIYGTVRGGDTLTALGANDTLAAFAGSETLVAGPGSTLLNGTGVDTDKFSLGSATVSGGAGDMVFASTTTGTGNLLFSGVAPSAVTMWDTSAGQLKIQFSPTDIVTIMGGSFSAATGFTEHGLGSATFDTPTNFGFSLTGGLSLTAAANGQEIYGTVHGGDTLTALGTNDTLAAFAGSETLVAGPGSTLLNGTGVDTDKFGLGSATVSGGTGDTVFASTTTGIGNLLFTGVAPSAVTMWDTNSGQLKIQFSATDIVTVMGGSFSTTTGFTEHGLGSATFDTPTNFGFSLAGGLNLTASANSQTIYGTVGGGDTLTALGVNDTLQAFGGTETLVAGSGSAMIGGSGRDTYVIAQGEGHTTVSNTGGGVDQIQLGAGLAEASLSGTVSGNNLILTFAGDSSDQITITNQFLSGHAVQTLSFSGGPVISLTAPPVAVPGSFSTQENAVLTGNVITNNGHPDTDPNGLALSVVAAQLTTAHGGAVALNADGSFAYTPAAGYYGADSFSYTLHDALGLSATGNVSLTVAPTPPVAEPGNFSVNENAVLSDNVITNDGNPDTDANGLALSVHAATLTTAHGGAVALAADGSFTYTPAAGYYGADGFNYILQDTAGASATGSVAIGVVPTPPVAEAGNFSVNENAVLCGNLIANQGNPDTDPNGLALSVQAATLTTAHGGAVVLNTDGSFTYTPAAGYYGPDSFNYTLQDTAGASVTGGVAIGVVPTPPVAEAGNFSVNENAVLSDNVITNQGNPDTDPNGLALSVQAATLTTAQGGAVVLNTDGSFAYTPAAGYYGPDGFNYTLQDTAGATATGSVTVGVVPTPPVAEPGLFDAAQTGSASGNVITNNGNPDNDPNGLALSIVPEMLTTANGGHVTVNDDGSFTYRGQHGFIGSDGFSYTLQDTAGATATGDVTIANIFADTPPTAENGSFSAAWMPGHATTFSGNVMADNGSGPAIDIYGDTLHVSAASATTTEGFAVAVQPDGSFSVMLPEWFVGTDSFSYTISDPYGLTSTAVETLQVTAPAGAIIGTNGNDILTATASGQYLFGLEGNDTFHDFGASGAVTMVGGPGDNTYYVNNSADAIYQSPDGVGSVVSSVNYTMAENITTLTLTGTHNLTAQGNSLDDTIIGNSGADQLVSGSGNDTFYVNSLFTTVQDSYTTNSDTIVSSVNYALPNHVNTLVLTGSANLATANGGNDTIVTDTAIDTVIGGAGTDNIYVNNTHDSIVTLGGGTYDVFSSVNYTLPLGVQSLTLTGTSSLTGTGGVGNETLAANNAGDTLKAGVGNDILDGGAGNDNLIGGVGNDLFYGGGGHDLMTAGVGLDTFQFKEATAFAGVAEISHFGNNFGNVIDISDVISAVDPLHTLIDNFVEITASGKNSVLSINAQGSGNHWVEIAQIDNVTGLNVDTMIAEGHLKVHS